MADFQGEGINWYESDTIKRSIVALGTAIVPMVTMGMLAFGYEVDEALHATLVAFVLQVINMVFSTGAIFGRLKAKKEIKPKASQTSGSQGGYAQMGMLFALSAIGVAFCVIIAYSQMAKAAEGDPTIKLAFVTIEAPTKRVDGSPLSADEIKHYIVNWEGPDGLAGDFIQKDTVGSWAPPVPGDYTLMARTVDTNDLVSEATMPVSYSAIEIVPSPPAAPQSLQLTVELSLPIDGVTPVADVKMTSVVKAISFLDKTSSADGMDWEAIQVDERMPIQAPMAKVSQGDISTNARIDYLVNTQGGLHMISFTAYAKDGLSDSVYVGLNGKPNPDFNQGQPIFFSQFGQWMTSTPVPIDLPAGQSVITLFMREPNLLIDSFELRAAAL